METQALDVAFSLCDDAKRKELEKVEIELWAKIELIEELMKEGI